MIRRRDFIVGLGSAAALPVIAPAQQPAMPVIGYLSAVSADLDGPRSFRKGLSEAGYVEGRNVAVEYRWAEGHYDRLPALALELIRRQVAAIMTISTPAALAAKAATTTIPIVFNLGSDPVKWGLVASLNRPGGNVTGVSVLTNALGAKNLQLLHQLVPDAALVAMLVNPANQNAEPDAKEAQAAARLLGLRLLVLKASDQSGIEAAFATLVQERARALLVSSDVFFVSAGDQIVALAARHRVPAMYDRREFTMAGGLVSYGPNIPDTNRQVGVYVGRILKGDKPADLPVQQVTKIEMVLNLKTAKALGLEVPTAILLRADEVIE
jgi:putative tryptophan/tyrosine transport system substrate-binding protein